MFVVWISKIVIKAGTSFYPARSVILSRVTAYFERPLLRNWQTYKSNSVNSIVEMIDTFACSIFGQLTILFISA